VTTSMPPRIGGQPVIDPGVIVGYRPGRAEARGLCVGDRARLRSGTVLYEGARIGDRFETGHHVVIREDNVIGDDVSIWSNTVVDYGCVIGDKVKIHANCYVAQYSTIEEGAFLAPGVTLTNDLYPGSPESLEAMTGPTIGAGAQIGANATVLPFVNIGNGALIGAGSVVTRDIPPDVIAYGCPAVVVRALEELEPIADRIRVARGSRPSTRTWAGG
jgi:acetyltransferase-like isoleucine patch superfamily enzyme